MPIHQTSWLFSKAIALIYFFAFASILPQITSLIGNSGIAPAREFFHMLRQQYGGHGWLLAPSLFYFCESDVFLIALCVLGIFAAALAVYGFYPRIQFFLLWLFYLSLVNAGQEFMAFQWDHLLLEAGFLTIFVVPWYEGDRKKTIGPWEQYGGSAGYCYLFRWLLFRVMFFSGLFKWIVPHSGWLRWDAVRVFLETQPLPSFYSWFLYHLPLPVHGCFLAGMMVMELAVPWLFFCPRQWRCAAAWCMTGYQCLLFFTGNYGFLNLLMLALGIMLLDDDVFPSKMLQWARVPNNTNNPSVRGRRSRWLSFFFLVCLWIPTMDQLLIIVQPFQLPPAPLRVLRSFFRPLRSFNEYALFTVNPDKRREIILEASQNRITWKAYTFRFKPDHLKRSPDFMLTYQPRLDWLTWITANGMDRQPPWFLKFCSRLLEGNKKVMGLLESCPFPRHAPRYLRAYLYDYRFSDAKTLIQKGEWWQRVNRVSYIPILSLRKSS